jgi:hypothetical protein
MIARLDFGQRDAYHSHRVPEPPPSAAEIDAYMTLPLTPLVTECLACPCRASCLTTTCTRRQFVRPLCNAANFDFAGSHATSNARQKLVAALTEHGPLTFARLLDLSGCKYGTARTALDQLRKAGVIVSSDRITRLKPRSQGEKLYRLADTTP